MAKQVGQVKTYEVKLTLVVGVDEKPGVDTKLRLGTMLTNRLTQPYATLVVANHRVDSVTELNAMKVEVKP